MPGHLTNRWHTLRRTYLRSAKSDHITFHPWSNFSADASLPKAHILQSVSTFLLNGRKQQGSEVTTPSERVAN